MALSCECDEYDWNWYWIGPVGNDFTVLDTKKRRRCQSCKKLIDIGTPVLKFERFRGVRNDIEERIYLDEVPLAFHYLCESCGEIWLNLSDLGYCLQLGDDMRGALKEYHERAGWTPGHGPGTKEKER